MLKYCNLEEFPHNKMLLFCLATACVDRKVSVTSNNHMMHPLTINGNRYIMADSLKNFRGSGGEIFAI